MKPDLREALKTRILTGDGAMGTYLYQMGFPVGVSYEEFNLLRPEVIADVHRRYYEAGARIIETNTFSANLRKLIDTTGWIATWKRLTKRVSELRGTRSAAMLMWSGRSARSGRVNVKTSVRNATGRNRFTSRLMLCWSAGVDGLLLETFYDLEEVLLALRIVRKVSDIPVICQFAVEKEAVTQDGHPLANCF